MSSLPNPPPPVEYDLSAARKYLHDLVGAMWEASTSHDPRVVYLGVQLARFQGKEGLQ